MAVHKASLSTNLVAAQLDAFSTVCALYSLLSPHLSAVRSHSAVDSPLSYEVGAEGTAVVPLPHAPAKSMVPIGPWSGFGVACTYCDHTMHLCKDQNRLLPLVTRLSGQSSALRVRALAAHPYILN